MLQFINPALDVDRLRRDLDRRSVDAEVNGTRVRVLEGAVVVEDFLTPEARQQLEGHIYSSGFDLQKVFRTSKTGFGNNELNIPEADRQIPLIGELRQELDTFLESVFHGALTTHTVQLRELAPKESGHPRHVDYERGFDVVERDGARQALTSVSLSLPISWNDGKAPVFIMEDPQGAVRQLAPGSLALFGPRIYHEHPPTNELEGPYLWLVTQAFFRTPLDGSGDAVKQGSPIQPDRVVHGASIAQWISGIVQDEAALRTLRGSEARIRRAYKELLSGYDINPATILNEVERVTEYHGLVVERDIMFTSFCGHHFLPFHGTIDVAYEPNEIITGLGKIPRLVQAYARRLQLQEDLVRDIAQQIMTTLDAKGVFVKATAIHLCVHGRGPLAPGTEVVCSYALGSLEPYARAAIDQRL